MMVSRTGKATLAWTAAPGGFEFYRPQIIGIADVPPTLGDPQDPQDPPGPPDPQDPLDAQVDAAIAPSSLLETPNGDLGIDGADVQTVMWHQDLLTPPGPNQVFTEFYDVVISDRTPGGRWSTSPVVVTGWVWNTQLAVNASGAAVVVWQETRRRGTHVYASHRDTAGSGWTSPRRVPDAESVGQVGIDDAGRVLLVYLKDRPRKHGGLTVRAIRHTPGGRWGKPQRVGGPNTYQPRTALGAGGAAVMAYSHIRFDDDGPAREPQFMSRMSSAGTWAAPVRQPDGVTIGPRAIDMDAKGRALIAWWDGRDLMGRWSWPDGRWRKPCVIAADVSKPRRSQLDTQVVVNRRGDALVVWRAKGMVGQLWARYKPAGHEWTEPVMVTRADSPPRAQFGAAIGDGGHVASPGRRAIIARSKPCGSPLRREPRAAVSQQPAGTPPTWP